MRTIRDQGAALLAVLAAGWLGAAGVAAAATYDLPGHEVAVYDPAGQVQVVGGTGDKVTVEFTARGRDAGRLTVATGVLAGRQTLRVLYPKGDIVYREAGNGWSSTTLSIREDGRFNDNSMKGLGEMFLRHVRIKASGGGTEASADMVVRVPKGLKVSVYSGVGQLKAAGVDADLHLDGAAARVDSRDTRGHLTVDVGSGSVTVTGAEGLELVDTGSGDVSVSRVHGEAIKLDTGSGSVRADVVKAKQFKVDTGSGGVRLTGVDTPDLYVDTGSGSVEAALTGAPGRIRIDTGSGSISLGLPATTNAHVHASTGSGGIHCDLPMAAMHKDEDSLDGTLGNGQGTIRLDTGSGSIRLHGGGVTTSAAE